MGPSLTLNKLCFYAPLSLFWDCSSGRRGGERGGLSTDGSGLRRVKSVAGNFSFCVTTGRHCEHESGGVTWRSLSIPRLDLHSTVSIHVLFYVYLLLSETPTNPI